MGTEALAGQIVDMIHCRSIGSIFSYYHRAIERDISESLIESLPAFIDNKPDSVLPTTCAWLCLLLAIPSPLSNLSSPVYDFSGFSQWI